ncbi:UbiA prenyltransferase family-domain-containing protein [Clohesyomyces aquaticus]|uniref:UbiA prenyltransferase family-domain-containing protein n=1 Tax=Clohesyomyces aquaticus TaxID=1231657 RepID=A0A1Y2A2X2_9PLEO|nr:UbiA prenyltransferase family-domain-containing protein [Clohesyomyces aquaticus]
MVLLQYDMNMSTRTLSKPSRFHLSDIIDAIVQLQSLIRTLYLFTANDFMTFAIPTTLFAVFGACSGPVLTSNPNPDLLSTLLRLPAALLGVWTNLLIFNISNQRSPSAVEEDKINKPHRPLPSGLITSDGSRRVLLAAVPLVLLLNWTLGAWQETLLLFTSTWMYNDLQGCDEDWILRNLLIAVGYGLYSCAALRIMTGSEHSITATGLQWLVIITLVMFITQHICDIKDQEGDRSRGRRSAPIVLGDELVRWSVAVPILVSSIISPMFFGLRLWSGMTLSTLIIGSTVAARTMVYRDLKSDKLTWKLWAFWTCWLFALPLAKDPRVVAEIWYHLSGMVCPNGDCYTGLNVAAVSGVALVIEGRRLYGHFGAWLVGNVTVPKIVVEGVM